ncbi:outer membrane protein assembly factor BamA [Kiritimatiella glycovorans]|uniref:Outer membrane protein assembly factor BamA n=1 Tax=Kiritimatiella glycovorans TaxID=1307763 RepID=A0A0G3EJX3_9BACT|nr:outer membrane protein assembly factor BamA [Kiritimatiella glycovorans]AKJ64429.1 Outer membrane protein Omp85 [Kiritimatiella glycovorans]
MNASRWIAAALIVASGATQAGTVKDLDVKNLGRARVEPSAVTTVVALKEGQNYENEGVLRHAVSEDVRRLRDAERFAYVAADVEPVGPDWRVVFQVKGRPRVRDIEVQGAKAVTSRKIRNLMELERGAFVDDLTLAARIREVKEHYRKHHYPYADIDWDLQWNEDESVDVRIAVDEGKKLVVKQVEIVGNEAVKDKVLRKELEQKGTSILSWITGAGTYKAGAEDHDRAAVRRVYHDRGYLDAEVSGPDLEVNKRGKAVYRVKVEEGPRYELGDVSFDESRLFPQEELRAAADLHSGAPASVSAIESAAGAIRGMFGRRGFIHAYVHPVMTPRESGEVVDVHFEIDSGEKAYIREIRIRGNRQTQDKVIRRELTIEPGEVYNSEQVETSKRRLQNLGYFKSVEDHTEPADEKGIYDLTFKVEEQPTGRFMIGGGVSSVENVVGFMELSQGNFDITRWPPVGAGQKAKMRVALGSERQDVRLNFVEPWFLDRRLSLGVDLFHTSVQYYSDEFDQQNTGGRVSLTKPLTSFDRFKVQYSLEQISIDDVAAGASDFFKAQAGDYLRSGLNLSLIHDTRDNYFVPHRGNRSIAETTLTGPGDVKIYGLRGRTSQYWPVWWDHVFNVRGEMAFVDNYGDDDVPVFDRLFLGGPRDLRGFDFREVGPKDDNDEPIGGKTSLYATAEYTAPVWKKVRAATFYDIGFVSVDAFDPNFDGLHSDYGVGLRFDMRGFPLQIDYAWPLQSEGDADEGAQFNFNLGYTF